MNCKIIIIHTGTTTSVHHSAELKVTRRKILKLFARAPPWQIDAADVGQIAEELELEAADAERLLRENGGDITQAFRHAFRCHATSCTHVSEGTCQ